MGLIFNKVFGVFAALASIVQALALLFAYNKGKDAASTEATKKALKDATASSRLMDRIRRMSDDDLNDELRK